MYDLENDSTNMNLIGYVLILRTDSNILKNSSEALVSLKKAIELDSNNSTALHLYGYNVESTKFTRMCFKFYEKSLKINNRSYLTL